MMNNTHTKQRNSAKKAYRQPQLKTLGSVKQLTLKLGSLTDSGQAGNFQ